MESRQLKQQQECFADTSDSHNVQGKDVLEDYHLKTLDIEPKQVISSKVQKHTVVFKKNRDLLIQKSVGIEFQQYRINGCLPFGFIQKFRIHTLKSPEVLNSLIKALRCVLSGPQNTFGHYNLDSTYPWILLSAGEVQKWISCR